MNRIRKFKWAYILLGIVFFITWTINNFIIFSFGTDYNSVFNMVYASVLVLLAITSLNEILVKEKEIITNPVFWICAGMIIFFTYAILVEVFWLYGMSTDVAFSGRVYAVFSWVNLFCNLIYAVAILWMRKKQAFMLRF
ncbi:MAG TPA: hypothetical protein VM012_06835 [Flavitalea sp.]|nr:hypothetical protein [Flavitalea sp.]